MKFLLICAFLVSHHTFCSMIIQDPLNGTELNYAFRDTKFDQSIWSDKKMYVLTFTNPSEWKGLVKLEENLKKWAKQLMIDEQLKNKAIHSMRKDLLFLYQQKAIEFSESWDFDDAQSMRDYCNNIIPENMNLNMDAFTINGHVLVVDLNVFAIEKDRPGLYNESLEYDELHYFDLHTGEKLDPTTFLDASKLTQLRNKLKKEVPKEVWESIQESINLFAEPVFYGASFYLNLKGSANALSEMTVNYHQRFTLEEIQPYLNENGPLKIYLNYKEEFPDLPFIVTGDMEIRGGWFQKDYIALQDEHYLIEEAVNPGIHSASYFYQTKNGNQLVEFAKYNNEGKIILKVRYDYENGEAEDSIAYHYHSNGVIKNIENYSFEEVDDYDISQKSTKNKENDEDEDEDEDEDGDDIVLYKATLDELSNYDEHGYLMECIYYNNDWSEYFSYESKEIVTFYYFKNKVVYDNYVENILGTGISKGGANFIDLWENFIIENNVSYPVLSLKKEGDNISALSHYINKDTISFDLTLKDNRVVNGKEKYGKLHEVEFNVEYNVNGQPISYINKNYTIQTGITQSNVYSVKRDSFGKVISYEVKYITPKEENIRTYNVVYE